MEFIEGLVEPFSFNHKPKPADSELLKRNSVYCPAYYVKWISEVRQNSENYHCIMSRSQILYVILISSLSSIWPGSRSGESPSYYVNPPVQFIINFILLNLPADLLASGKNVSNCLRRADTFLLSCHWSTLG